MENSDEIIEKRKSSVKNFLTSWITNNYDKTFFAILIIAFIIRFIVFLKTMNQPIWWDGADYLVAAKRWGLGLDIRDIWYFRRGFFWPIFCAIFFKLGLGEIGIRFSEVLFSIGIIFVSYFIVSEMFDKKKALLVSLCLSFSWIVLFFTGRILTELPSTFFLLLSLLFFWKGYVKSSSKKFLIFFGIFYALAVLTRMQLLMFAPCFLIFAFLKNKISIFKNKNLWFAVLSFLIILSPQIYLYSSHYGNPVKDILAHYFGVNLETEVGSVNERTFSSVFNYIKDLPYSLDGTFSLPLKFIFILFFIGALIFLFELLLGIDKFLSHPEIMKKIFILLWLIIPFLVLGYITDYVEHRYLMPVLPFLFLLVVFPLNYLEGMFEKKFNFSKVKSFVCVFLILFFLLIPNLIWANQLIESKKISFIEVKQAGEWIKENSNLTDIIISNSLPQIEYYSERSTYPFDLGKTGGKYKANQSEFEKFVYDKKPKYLIISGYENQEDWVNAYLQKNAERFTPVKTYKQGEQFILVVYEFKYT